MKTLLVEDNITFGEELTEKLKQRRSFSNLEWCLTESDFVDKFDKIKIDPPSVFVIDVMLQWDVPRREGIRPRPPEARNMYKAGIRCAQRLLDEPKTSGLPIILYTLVDQPDLQSDIERLPPNVRYLQKGSDLEPLMDLMRKVTASAPSDQLHG